MDRISDEQLDTLIDFLAEDIKTEKRPVFFVTHSALTELRERRERDKANLANINAELDRTICQICERRHDIGNPCYRIK